MNAANITVRSNSTMGFGNHDNFGIKGYAIAKDWRIERTNKHIQNWKAAKLADRGRFTYLEDV